MKNLKQATIGEYKKQSAMECWDITMKYLEEHHWKVAKEVYGVLIKSINNDLNVIKRAVLQS